MKLLWQSDERTKLGPDENPEIVRQHISRYNFAAGFVHEKRVLDVACGVGYGSGMLKTAGAYDVFGVDRSEDTILFARRDFGREGIGFHVGVAEDLSGFGKFDVVVSFETIEHLERPEKFLEEVSRILKDDGLLIISTPVRESGSLDTKPENPFHEREWSEAEFDLLLRQYFPACKPYYQFNVSKGLVPFSRTLKRSVLRFLHRDAFSVIDSYPVLAEPPQSVGFQLEPIYFVRLCRFR